MNKAMARPQKAKVSTQLNDATQQHIFLLLCSLAGQDDSLNEAVHALYYLPQNYELVVTGAAGKEVADLLSDAAIMDRIHFEENTGKADQVSPFSYVIDNENKDVITIKGSNDRTVTVSAHHPEAFASAVLNLSRARA